MAEIKVLEPHVADLIAAGEVVERPASVVKELVENSLDAGATAITVEIKRGGIEYIRVTDNGCGISPDAAPTAFLRHATSKISSERDLEGIGTLGFRGEALAAVAAVSKIDLMTKTRNEQYGILLKLNAGKQCSSERSGCPEGTTIIVRELFFNTPARMKFLKSDSAEGAAVDDVVRKVAVSVPEVSVKLIRDGKQILHSPGDGLRESAIYALFGREVSNAMLSASSEEKSVKVSGFTVQPSQARGNRSMQFFFVNSRCIKSKALSAALDQAYRDLIMKGKFPSCFLFIELPNEQVDVNVHPAKTEVKFAFENEVFHAVYSAVKCALTRGDITQAKLAADSRSAQDAPPRADVQVPNGQLSAPAQAHQYDRVSFNSPKIMYTHSAEPDCVTCVPLGEEPVRQAEPEPCASKPVFTANAALENRDTAGEDTAREETVTEFKAGERSDKFRVIGEVLCSYIVVETDTSMLLIDKHAAHERIIFERLKKLNASNDAQMLLTPVVVPVTETESEALLSNSDTLWKLGFAVEDFGNAVAIRQIPSFVDIGAVEKIITEFASCFMSGARASLDELYHSVACHAAIKAGKPSVSIELETIARAVMTDSAIRYCPHGRPVVIELTKSNIEKQFSRT